MYGNNEQVEPFTTLLLITSIVGEEEECEKLPKRKSKAKITNESKQPYWPKLHEAAENPRYTVQ